MAACLLVTKSSPPLGGGLRKRLPPGALSRVRAYRPSCMLDRRSLVQAPNAPRDHSQHPHARNDYDEETSYESNKNPEPGLQSDPGDSTDAEQMAPCLLVTKSSPRSGGAQLKNTPVLITTTTKRPLTRAIRTPSQASSPTRGTLQTPNRWHPVC